MDEQPWVCSYCMAVIAKENRCCEACGVSTWFAPPSPLWSQLLWEAHRTEQLRRKWVRRRSEEEQLRHLDEDYSEPLMEREVGK